MPAETFFGRRKCFAGLQELFADVAKGMHACGNIFRKVKCCSTFPNAKGCSTFPSAKDGLCDVRLMSSERRTEAPKNTWPTGPKNHPNELFSSNRRAVWTRNSHFMTPWGRIFSRRTLASFGPMAYSAPSKGATNQRC